MPVRWYHNAKTGEIDWFTQEETLTDFPRGVFLAYGDYLTIGFKSKDEAVAWANEWGDCTKCKAARKPNGQGVCPFCGGKIQFIERKE